MTSRALLIVAAVLASVAAATAQRSSPGTAKVSLSGADVNVTGDFPTTLCGGPFMLGKGMAWQTKAGDWQITVASENRTSGTVPLNEKDGSVNVVVAVNGPGRSYVRRPTAKGSLTVSDDFKKAEGTLELRNAVGKETATLVVTFTCQ
jgi:hypothetical protein